MNSFNKNIMKVIGFLAIVGSISFITSCSDEFLDVQPTGVLTPDAFGNEEGVNQVLVGAYSQLQGAVGFYSGPSNWLHGSIRGGEAHKGSTPGDQAPANPVARYEQLPTNGIVADKWRETYDGVARSNFALQTIALAGDDLEAAFRDNASGQALFLRSYYLMQIALNFKNGPYITEDISFEEIGNQPSVDLMPLVAADFKRAADLLPNTQDAVGKANKWAALAMYGKALMFVGDYPTARVVLEDVIANGQTSNGLQYDLFEDYSQVFNAEFDNGPESIFAVQASANTGSSLNSNPGMVLNFPNGGGPAGCCGFFQPSFELVSSFRTDADGLPLLDESYRNPANQVVSDYNIEADDPSYVEDAGNLDPRLDHSVGRRGIPYLDWGDHPGNLWIRQRDNGGPFAPKKFIFRQAQEGVFTDASAWTAGYTAINYNVIRFADVLLLAAEAHIEDTAGGDLDRALELINRVRTRAANANAFVKNADGTDAANYVIGLYPSGLSREQLRAGVRFERKLELSGEGHRLYDLNRWGIAADYLNSYLQFESGILPGPIDGARFDANRDEYYPIPQVQIDLSGGLYQQNPGY